ncbi:MAG: hypothetical protein LUE12_07100 [Ruminococcus sp.]|nr:hypothetical protein [Ruminococcus sp.]
MIGYYAIFGNIMSNVSFILHSTDALKNIADRMELLYSDLEAENGERLENIESISANKLSFSFDEKRFFRISILQ